MAGVYPEYPVVETDPQAVTMQLLGAAALVGDAVGRGWEMDADMRVVTHRGRPAAGDTWVRFSALGETGIIGRFVAETTDWGEKLGGGMRVSGGPDGTEFETLLAPGETPADIRKVSVLRRNGWPEIVDVEQHAALDALQAMCISAVGKAERREAPPAEWSLNPKNFQSDGLLVPFAAFVPILGKTIHAVASEASNAQVNQEHGITTQLIVNLDSTGPPRAQPRADKFNIIQLQAMRRTAPYSSVDFKLRFRPSVDTADGQPCSFVTCTLELINRVTMQPQSTTYALVQRNSELYLMGQGRVLPAGPRAIGMLVGAMRQALHGGADFWLRP